MMTEKVAWLDRIFLPIINECTPQEILALETTPQENERLDYLSARKKGGTLSVDETVEIEMFLTAERYVRMAKATAYVQLNK